MTLQCVIIRTNPNNSTVVTDTVWTRDGMSIQSIPNHSSQFNFTTRGFTDLVITDVRLEDDNTVYTCSAIGATITSSIMLNVAGILYVCAHTYKHIVNVRIHTFIANSRISIIYWQIQYLAIDSKMLLVGNLNWWISVLYEEKAMHVCKYK